ncbi:MAG: hypothetical protein RML36_10085 [Anaerolineae bacterium]|nr:hypothetical protein [Anaerolineae bacterium]MDW8099816.1 hypothetical protein [Anaerolineae bacterium]
MSGRSRGPTDYRGWRRRLDRELLFWVIALLLVVGGGLIGLIYGGGALVLGLGCLAMGAGVILLLWGVLSLIERWVGRDE